MPWELRKDGSKLQEYSENLFLGILTPAFNRVIQMSWQMRLSKEALITVIAVLRYEKDMGIYPESTGFSMGKITVKKDPSPGVLSTSIKPPMESRSPFTIGSPSPVPVIYLVFSSWTL